MGMGSVANAGAAAPQTHARPPRPMATTEDYPDFTWGVRLRLCTTMLSTISPAPDAGGGRRQQAAPSQDRNPTGVHARQPEHTKAWESPQGSQAGVSSYKHRRISRSGMHATTGGRAHRCSRRTSRPPQPSPLALARQLAQSGWGAAPPRCPGTPGSHLPRCRRRRGRPPQRAAWRTAATGAGWVGGVGGVGARGEVATRVDCTGCTQTRCRLCDIGDANDGGTGRRGGGLHRFGEHAGRCRPCQTRLGGAVPAARCQLPSRAHQGHPRRHVAQQALRREAGHDGGGTQRGQQGPQVDAVLQEMVGGGGGGVGGWVGGVGGVGG